MPNPYSEAYRQALQQLDLEAALSSLDESTIRAVLFGVEMRPFTVEELADMLASIGFEMVADYGIRCVTDYIYDNQIKSQPQFYEQLVKLERAMGQRAPYKRLARFLHVLVRKG